MGVCTFAAFLMLFMSSISGAARLSIDEWHYAHAAAPAKAVSSTKQQYWTQAAQKQPPLPPRLQNQQLHHQQNQQQIRTLNTQPKAISAAQATTSRSRSIKQQQQQKLLRFTDALAPEGGLPLSTIHTMNPRILFMAVIADFAYVKELGSSARRQDCAPCLRLWGAQGDLAVIDSIDEVGGTSHCTVFRTDNDLFLVFRGLDELSSIYYIEMDTSREYAAEYFGVPNTTTAAQDEAAAAAAGERRRQQQADYDRKSSSSSSSSSSNESGRDEQFYVLRGFLRAHKSIEPLYTAQLNQLATQLPMRQRSRYKIWIIGHSDGSSLAQLAALRLSYTLGTDKLGGVVLFGTQRVGSPAFANYYNSVLGNQTLRVQYGWDPATEFQYLASEGLKLVGKGFAICPNPGHAIERLVDVPLGVDVPFVCGKPTAGTSSSAVNSGSMGPMIAAALVQPYLQSFAKAAMQGTVAGVLKTASTKHANKHNWFEASRHVWAQRRGSSTGSTAGCTAGIPGAGKLYWHIAAADTTAAELQSASAKRYSSSSGSQGRNIRSSSSSNGVLDIQYLAHHMPSVIYDGVLRVLGSDVGNGTLAALQLPLCAISSKCAAALRQNPGSRCATCATAETCSQYWQGAVGPKCDNLHPLWSGNLCYGSFFPPGIIGLLGLFGT